MTPHEVECSERAVDGLYRNKGDGFCFPPDLIWEYYERPIPDSLTRPGLVKALERGGSIVLTGRTTRSVSPARKGNPVREYTFGARVSPSSLQRVLGNNAETIPPAAITHPDDPAEHTPGYADFEPNPNGRLPLELPLQRIVHGCPGSGKSFLLGRDAAFAHFFLRVVFHPEIRYGDFVGAIRPESIYRISGEEMKFAGSESLVRGEPYVQYVVRPGALLKAYHLACLHPDCSVVLIIEELSRAPASQVFGDMLQLLDRRDEPGDALTDFSEYEIEPQPDIRSWLRTNNITHDNVSPGNMRFPPNLYIWATMNRSDQNARQLDSAFLRRWSKTYISYRNAGVYDDDMVVYGGTNVRWGDLRNTINERLKDSEGIPEDKFVGPYFLSRRQLRGSSSVYEDLWGYIWNDVLKARAAHFFNGIATFADLQVAWNGGSGSPIGPIRNESDATPV